jgi:transposase
MAYSYEVRKIILTAYNNGMTYAEIKTNFGVSATTFYNWKKRQIETGDCAKKYGTGATPQITTEDFEAYMQWPENQAKTQPEIAAHFGTSAMTISNMLYKISFTRKKRATPTVKQMR